MQITSLDVISSWADVNDEIIWSCHEYHYVSAGDYRLRRRGERRIQRNSTQPRSPSMEYISIAQFENDACLRPCSRLFGIRASRAACTWGSCMRLLYELCLMLMYLILGNLVYRNFTPDVPLCGIGGGSYRGALWRSPWHVGLFPSFTSETVLALVIASGLLAALFLHCLHMFAEKNLDDSWGSIVKTPISKDMGLLLEKSRLGLRCHELAEEAGLSKGKKRCFFVCIQEEAIGNRKALS